MVLGLGASDNNFIHFQGRPLAPVIVSEEVQGRYGVYTLIWKISEDNSTNIPVSLYVIQYRREDTQVRMKPEK